MGRLFGVLNLIILFVISEETLYRIKIMLIVFISDDMIRRPISIFVVVVKMLKTLSKNEDGRSDEEF